MAIGGSGLSELFWVPPVVGGNFAAWLSPGVLEDSGIPIGPGGGMSIGGTVTGGTPGSVLFVDGSGNLGQDNAKFFWDDTGFSLKLKAGSTLALGGSGSGTVTLATQAAAGTWTLSLPTSGGTNGFVLQTDGFGVTSWVTAGAGTVAIGSAVTGGTPGSVLFVAAGPVLAQDNTDFFWDDTGKMLKIGHSGGTISAYFTNGARALYTVPNVTSNNWFEGNAGNLTVTGYGNFGAGDSSLLNLTSGFNNTAIGGSALNAATTAHENFALGSNSMLLTQSDFNNVAIGTTALQNLGQAGAGGGNNQANIGIGFGALNQVSIASNNIAIGFNAGGHIVAPATATANVLIGTGAGNLLGTGGAAAVNNNTFIGPVCGGNLTDGINNSWFGGYRGPSAAVSYTIAISDGASLQLLDMGVTSAGILSLGPNNSFGFVAGLHLYNVQDAQGAAQVNWERGVLDWSITSNVFRLATQKGGTGTIRLIAIDGFQKAGAPAAGDLPSGTWTVINDTAGGNTWVVYNNAGAIRKVQLV